MFSVVLTLFDENNSAIAAYFNGIDENAANEIAKHTIIRGQDIITSRLEGKSIVALPGFSSVAFFYFFQLNIPRASVSDFTPAVLAFIARSEKQLLVYQSSATLSAKAQDIIDILKKELEKEYSLSGFINNKIINEIIDREFFADQTIVTGSENRITFNDLIRKGDINKLIKLVLEDLDNAIYGMIAGKTVVVTGDEKSVSETISSLAAFAPHRQLSIVPWTDAFTDADIIGIDREHLIYYPRDIIIDINKKRAFRGRKNSFCSKLLDEIRDKSHESACYIIKKRINWLLSKVSAFALVIKEDKSDEIFKTIAATDRETLYLIATLLEQSSPLLANKLYDKIGKDKMKSLV
ncbi:MAG: hypothetical protein ACTSP4_10005 [Candidatus Hodarchaeales archaeon]